MSRTIKVEEEEPSLLEFQMDPYCAQLAATHSFLVASPAPSRKPVTAIKSVKGIPWPRPTDNKADVFKSVERGKPTFPWDFYVCDLVDGAATVGEILGRDPRGRGITRAIPEVFDGASYSLKQYTKFKETFDKASEQLIQEYVQYGRQERGEYIKLWQAVHQKPMMLEWVHGCSTTRAAVAEARKTREPAAMHPCSFCDLRFPGLIEKKSHERHQHNYPAKEVGECSWRTPLDAPNPGPSVSLYSSVHQSYHHAYPHLS